ncbi:MAG TPA: hypothetical protein VLX85_15860 [Stellaceae bacterium]|nr:hypothetical protein [Stellaceae bacterium]
MRSVILRSAGSLMLLALILAMPGLASAAGLTDADYRYLKAEFGVAKDSFVLRNISAADAAKLHDAISGALAKEFPQGRIYDTADLLFDVEMRTCEAWQLAHAATSCPQVTDERLEPGWEIAERNCIACHLTGTTDAPSFFKLVQHGPIDEGRLAAALRSGHPMSPITLAPQQVQDLARYINSLR